jgi:hypothetical protein
MSRRALQVLTNVVHVMTARVFGSWYHLHLMGEESSAVQHVLIALRQALTVSFGSVCRGSLLGGPVRLLLGPVRLLRDLSESVLRRSRCARSCASRSRNSRFAGLLNRLLRTFTLFPFAHVALHNRPYGVAAADSAKLARVSGISALLNLNSIMRAVALGQVVGATLSAATVALISHDQLYRQGIEAEQALVGATYGVAYALAILFAFACAFSFTGIASSVLTSGIATIFICWAEDPLTLFRSNPELHRAFEEATSQHLAELPSAEQREIHAMGGVHASRWSPTPTSASRAFATA